MTYYFLLRPCVGNLAGRTKLDKYLHANLKNLINYKSVESWFGMKPNVLPNITDYDTVLEFNKNSDIHTIALYISPYKRVFCYFLDFLGVIEPTDFAHRRNDITPEKFADFCDQNKTLLHSYLTNLTDAYTGINIPPITYELEYDTLISDMRKISGLEATPDSLILPHQQILNSYKDYYTEYTVELVKKKFAKDIELRGYTF